MRLIDKPHCKKHEVYEQGCIGCRRKLKDNWAFMLPTEAIYETTLETVDINGKRICYPSVTEKRSIAHDLAKNSPETTTGLVISAKKKEQVIKQFLKDVYRDGALGNKRNLQDDMETLQRLVQQNAGHKA